MMRQHSPLTVTLIALLGFGKANAVRREELASMLHVDDRTMRRCIAYARLEGVPICNDGDGNGYYIANRQEDARTVRERETRRAKSILANNRPFKEAERKMDTDQMRLPVGE